MYNQPPHGYSSNYAYGPSEEQQQQQQWMSQYPADANMYPSQGSAQGSLAPPGPPDWYTQSGPSSYNIPSSYANGNYAPPSHPGYRHSYTPPTNPSTATPDIGDLSYASSVVPKTEEKAVKEKGTKRKRKKGEEATSPTDAEKEKRTKTGRACDACVSQTCNRIQKSLLTPSDRRRSAAISSRPRQKTARRSNSVLIASSTIWNVPSSCQSRRRGSRRRSRLVR